MLLVKQFVPLLQLAMEDKVRITWLIIDVLEQDIVQTTAHTRLEDLTGSCTMVMMNLIII